MTKTIVLSHFCKAVDVLFNYTILVKS